MLYGIQCTSCNIDTHGMIVHLLHIIFMVNRLDDLRHRHMDSKMKAVRGESIGKAVRDLMRLSSGLEYLRYELVCTVVFERRYFTINILPQMVNFWYMYWFSMFIY